MSSNYFKTPSLLIGILFSTLVIGQTKQLSVSNFVNPFSTKVKQNTSTNTILPQNDSGVVKKQKFEIIDGSFYSNIKEEKISSETISENFNNWFNLNEKNSFQKVSEKTDELGFTHIKYQHIFKGVPINGNIIMMHSKEGIVNTINGRINNFKEIETTPIITIEKAVENAKTNLKVTDLINEYPVEKVIINVPKNDGFETKLAYKVRIDSWSPFLMYNVLVDANTGEILDKISLIAHADVTGTAQTLYSGTQTITCDNSFGPFRLREIGRKIETYNATNATGLTTGGLTGSIDYTNTSTTWGFPAYITSFTITTLSNNWWFAPLVDDNPDLYIVLKDGSNNIVYTSNYINNTQPPVTFWVNQYLNNPPYTIEIYDEDFGSSDDFGGSYPISTSFGTQTWSGGGNSGSYNVLSQGQAALDVHWGMEKTYDFYQSVFGRNSYDGFGSTIKNYLNVPGASPTNASAYPPPYNLMFYGLGDGVYTKPVVGLDVEGHEYTHLVVANNGHGGLVYRGEAGALNESFADIFGTCIEFYSGVSPDWTIGEDIMVANPYLRSMSNPNSSTGAQPDTYKGTFWKNVSGNPSPSNDQDGVHTNSGVQNFWFYLLSQGGSGTNDIGNAYSVTGIGINQARQIAYRNLTTYLDSNATYMDAFNGSLQAAEDLYGNPSTQYTAVRKAWYAVGIGNDPNNYCSSTTNLTAPSGTITDGSGSANYNNFSNCKWIIAPAGATQISLDFTYFDTETGYDTVFVYDGTDETGTLLMTWWGNTLPPTINTTAGVGAMCVKFTSDNMITAGGWSADYITYGFTPSCEGGTVLSSTTGSFNDGSGGSNYGNNQFCYWGIAPPCATSVTLSFSSFDTELNYDGVIIYDDLSGTNQIAVLTGNNIPTPITSTTGEMLVVFVSDYTVSTQGFTANYTSTGSAFCSGTTNLNTSDYATFTDGSGGSNYCNNQDCKWLIQPPQATSVTLNFSAFELEEAATDGTIYDAVEVYDGTTTSAPLLGRFTGSNLPPVITSSGGSMLVRFISDLEENKQGFSAYYTSTQNPYCTGTTTTLTAQNGTFADGSSSNYYANNTSCSWLIQPTNATTITLSFPTFDTELNYDGVIVYDGANNSAPILGQFTGTTIPSPVVSTSGSMYVEFMSDPAVRANGWTANYNSIITGIDENSFKQKFKIYPNPTSGLFKVESMFDSPSTIEITDLLGQQILQLHSLSKGIHQLDVSNLSKGTYLIKFKVDNSIYVERLILN